MLLGRSCCCVWSGWCQDRLRRKHRTTGHARLMEVAVIVWSWPSARMRCLDQVFITEMKLLGPSAIEQIVLMNWLCQCGLTTGEYWTTLRKASREGNLGHPHQLCFKPERVGQDKEDSEGLPSTSPGSPVGLPPPLATTESARSDGDHLYEPQSRDATFVLLVASPHHTFCLMPDCWLI